MKTLFRFIFIISLFLGLQMQTSAQCKKFTKSECKPLLKPYIYNGQLNSAVLSEGDFAELILTFYSNQEYRIVVCAEKELNNIVFKLSDLNGNEIFSNEDHNFVNHWDFSTNTTQQLRVEVSVPETSKEKEKIRAGCVSILVGFMDNK